MIGAVLALALVAADTETTDLVERNPALEIDPCVEVDEAAVRDLTELELRGSRARNAHLPISVQVRCTDDAQEIRVQPWASRSAEGIRAIQLTSTEEADPAAREARSRELALAIAELIRRLEITQPLVTDRPEPPPPPAPSVISPAAPSAEEPRGRWRLAVLSSFDHFTGGQSLAGGDVAIAAVIRRWMVGELRAGGRVGGGETLPSGRLDTRAAVAAAAAGFNVWSGRQVVGFAFMIRAQGYVVEYRAEFPADIGSRSTVLGAVVAAVEPRFLVAVTRRVSLVAAAAAGLPLHGIVVRAQGVETESLSGLFVSGNLGAVLTF